jgi:hypothetical protein
MGAQGNMSEEQITKIKREALIEASKVVMQCVNFHEGNPTHIKACLMDQLALAHDEVVSV